MELPHDASRPGISAWEYESASDSPNGLTHASYVGHEVGMGAPTLGILRLSTGVSIPRAGASHVWSDDSSRIAVPLWSQEGMSVGIFEAATGALLAEFPGFSVIELHAYEDGVVTGIDAPISTARAFSLAVPA